MDDHDASCEPTFSPYIEATSVSRGIETGGAYLHSPAGEATTRLSPQIYSGCLDLRVFGMLLK